MGVLHLLLQDTVVALRALARFAESTYTSDIEQSVIFSLPGLSSNVVRAVNNENRFQRFDVEVTSLIIVGVNVH